MPRQKRVLMALTSHAIKGDTGLPTGVWLEELAAPYYAFIEAGLNVDIVSIAGGEVPLDPASVHGEQPRSVGRFLADAKAMASVEASKAITEIDPAAYDAVFLPGGHGTIWDLPTSDTLASVLNHAWTSGKVVAAVCHGPSGLVAAKDAQGLPIISGRRVTGFTNSEEEAVGLTATVPFLLESRLRELGGHYQRGADFQAFAIRDGNLVTGQNPASSEETARLTIEALSSDR